MITDKEIETIVNQYIGVAGGYLGDFSYRTHQDFYSNFCSIDIDVNAFEGTTRQKFIAILQSRSQSEQIMILEGIKKRFPFNNFSNEEKQNRQASFDLINSIVLRLKSKRIDLNALRPGSIVNGIYSVTSIPVQKGGMGRVIFAYEFDKERKVVLKFCSIDDDEVIQRFKREVRLLQSYNDTSHVIKIHQEHLDFTPPFFVMEFAETGDLTELSSKIKNNFAEQEKVFLRMVDCVEVIHQKGHFHRDIKPENFLVCGSCIKISDFGLAQDPSSTTRMTVTHQWGGTRGYFPPQFFEGGFKNTEYSDDIFSLGKSFYNLLTGRDPTYLKSEGIELPLYRLIERCSNPERSKRYQSCEELRNAIKDVFDILLKRHGSDLQFSSLKEEVFKKLNSNSMPDAKSMHQLVESLISQTFEVKKDFIDNLPSTFIFMLTRDASNESAISSFIDIYYEIWEYATSQAYFPFSYAEGVASDCSSFFNSNLNNTLKNKMLQIAMEMSYGFHRTKAVQTCLSILYDITDDDLAFLVADLLREKRTIWHLDDLESSKFRHSLLAKVANELRVR